MFKAAKNSASNARPHISASGFAGSNTPRNAPLHPVTGNKLKRPASHSSTIDKRDQSRGFKRHNSGLASALPINGFDDYVSIPNAARSNTIRHTLDSQSYDLKSPLEEEFDFEVEQITANDNVSYPDLSHIEDLDALPPSSIQIPWTSSPASHYQSRESQISLNSFRHGNDPEPVSKPAAQPVKKAHSKPGRRNLPWASKEDFKTPAKKAFEWDMSSGAFKKIKGSLKDANARRVKTTEKENSEEIAKENLKKSRPYKIFLSDEQQAVLELVVQDGRSIFFTGSAGTGKSVLLREIIAHLKKKYHKEQDRVAITASTGLAACNIGGITLHSFAGIGLGNESVPELVKKIKRNPKAKHRWLRTRVLIMDEISMLDGDLYDKLEAIARTIKNDGRPFGGIQVIITGDFFQLPPVPERNKVAKFAFNANTWGTTITHTIALNKVFRQKDPEFANMLNEMREGRLTPKSIARFRSLSRDLRFDDDLEATELFSTRIEVDRANQMRLMQLDGETRIFEARDGGTVIDKERRDKLLANVMAPERISLKLGSQVMLIKNYDETLVNGSLGKVIGFMSETEFGNYHDDDEAYLATQAPPRKTNQTVVDLAGASSKFPVVRFSIADGTTRDMLCHRETWSIDTPQGEVQASRSQIPLILAWALSIHKAQGQTLERVKVNLSRAFERGQAYVALSRATSMAGLQVIGFDPKKVMAHEAVRVFYASLMRMTAKKEETNEEPSIPGAYPRDAEAKASTTKVSAKQRARASTVPRQAPKVEPKAQLPKASTMPDTYSSKKDEDAFWDSQFPDDDF